MSQFPGEFHCLPLLNFLHNTKVLTVIQPVMSQSCLVAPSSSSSALCRLVSFAAVIRVVMQRSSPLTAAH